MRLRDDPIDVGGLPSCVHDACGGDVRAQAREHLLRSHVVSIRARVGEPWFEAIEDDCPDGSRIRYRRDDDLAALWQIERGERQPDRRGPGRHGVCIAPAHHGDEVIRVALLEDALVAGVDSFRAVCAHRLVEHRDFRVAHREASRHGRLAQLRAAVDGEAVIGNALLNLRQVHQSRSRRCRMASMERPCAARSSSYLP